MQKKSKKISFGREILRPLGEQTLANVHGGGSSTAGFSCAKVGLSCCSTQVEEESQS